jgi:hypothetical protein
MNLYSKEKYFGAPHLWELTGCIAATNMMVLRTNMLITD